MIQICVVGDVGLDISAKLAGPIVGHDARASITVNPGGAGGNTAAWLARQNVAVSLIARVGDDQAGRTARAELTAAGIDCRFVVDPQLPTCCVVALLDPQGERTMLADRGANAALSPDDIVLPEVSGPRHLHLSGYVLLDQGSRAAGIAALQRATAAGWTTSVDPQAAVHVETVGGAAFLDWVTGVDLLLPNDGEIAALGGIAAALDRVGAVVVTHAGDGASWYADPNRVVTVPSPARHEVDATGAGDAFNAGLLAHWLAGASIEQSLTAGVAAGTEAAGRIGARPA